MEHMWLFLPLQHRYTIARCFDCAGEIIHINNDKEENMRRHQRLPRWPSLRDTRRGMINPDATPSGTSLPIFGHVCVCTTGKRLALVCVCARVWTGRESTGSLPPHNFKQCEPGEHVSGTDSHISTFYLPRRADWRSVFSFAPFFLPYLISTVNTGDEGRHFLVRLNVHDGNRW